MKKVITIVVCVIVVAVILVYFFAFRKKEGGAITAEPRQAAPAAADTSAPQEEVPTVEIPLDKQRLMGIKTATASLEAMEKTIRAVGKIEYDEERLSTVSAKVEGWIEKLYVPYTGAYVSKGQPLADIYSPELWATQQEYIRLLEWAGKYKKKDTGADEDLSGMLSRDSQSLLEAARQRLRLFDIPDEEIKKIEESGKPRRTLTIKSPVGGYVLQKYAVKGTRVMAGEKLLDLADLSQVWVTADIYEYELPFVRVGETADVVLSAVPGKTMSLRIDFVSPLLSADTRTAKVRFTVPNPGGRLRPQMFTDVELKVPLGKRLAVPSDAVIDTGLRKIVYVDKGDGYFEPREIAAGASAEKLTEITAGLKAGEKIAASANFLIDSEAKLKGVEPLPQTGKNQDTMKPATGQRPPPALEHHH